MENGIRALVEARCGAPKTKPGDESPLTWAFIGDAVFALIVSTIVVNKGNRANKKLHQDTSVLVSAKNQSKVASYWEENNLLTDEEKDILKRGMNACPKSKAKNASLYEYHRATGVEALCGYLYQMDRVDRVVELIAAGLLEEE